MNRRILQLALPNIVTNITIPLLGMVDLGLMGHMGSPAYVGAIAIGGMIFNFLFWGFGFLRMGTSGFTAQAFGARDLAEASNILVRALFTGLAGGLLLILLQWPISLAAFRLIHGDARVVMLAQQYYAIRIWSAPATLCIYALYGWFIGMQNARIPMILAITINILNIAFSLVFVKIFALNSNGLAWASLLSQYSGLLLGLFFVMQYSRKLKKYFNVKKALRWKSFRGFISVNRDIFIRTLCLIFTLSFFTTQSANDSLTTLAVNTLLFQFFYFFSYFVDGFAYAAEALTGRYIGASDRFMLKAVIRKLFLWGTAIAIVFTLLYIAGARYVLQLLTNDRVTLDAAKPYLFWIMMVPCISFAAFIWDGIFVGATASGAMRNSMLVITTMIFLPAYYLLHPILGNHGLWLAMMLFMGSRGLFLSLMAPKAVFGKMKPSVSLA